MKNLLSRSAVKKELRKIEDMKKSGKYERDWNYLGGVQQALCWVLQNNAMQPSKVAQIK